MYDVSAESSIYSVAIMLIRLQHGVQNLILTSRSGVGSLQTRRDFVGKQNLDHLQSRALLHNGSLASEDQEHFDSLCPPKVDALDTLTRAVEVASIDSCVTFSSVAGMFGNAGQTSNAACVQFST